MHKQYFLNIWMALHGRRLEAEIWRIDLVWKGFDCLYLQIKETLTQLSYVIIKGPGSFFLSLCPSHPCPAPCHMVSGGGPFLRFVYRQYPQQKLLLLLWASVSWPGKPLGVWWQTSCPVFLVSFIWSVWNQFPACEAVTDGRGEARGCVGGDGMPARPGLGWKRWSGGLLGGSDSGTMHLLGFPQNVIDYILLRMVLLEQEYIFMEFSGEIV